MHFDSVWIVGSLFFIGCCFVMHDVNDEVNMTVDEFANPAEYMGDNLEELEDTTKHNGYSVPVVKDRYHEYMCMKGPWGAYQEYLKSNETEE